MAMLAEIANMSDAEADVFVNNNAPNIVASSANMPDGFVSTKSMAPTLPWTDHYWVGSATDLRAWPRFRVDHCMATSGHVFPAGVAFVWMRTPNSAPEFG
jgi:hypothetical protein